MSFGHGRIALSDGARALCVDELTSSVEAERRWLGATAAADARFALLADNGLGWAVADRALHESRRVNVPLPGYFTPAQLEHVLGSASVDLILTDSPQRFAGAGDAWQSLGSTPGSGLTALRRAHACLPIVPLPEGTTKITFTSGSTGQPKGVCLSADSIERVARSLADATAPLAVHRHLCLLPLATLLDNIAGLIAAPLNGATTLVPSLAETGINYGGVDVAALLNCIERHQPGSMILVPELLRVLVASVRRGWHAPASLRFIAVGGAPVAAELLTQADAVGLPVYEGYGLSECASVVALNTPAARRRGSVGQPLPHASVRIDAQGELHVAGATMLGYLGEADRPAAREIATGDLGRCDADGFLYIHGRAKNLIITSLGRNVSPEWIERELLAEPQIGQVVVFGDARPWLMALVVPAQGSATTSDIDAAIARANQRLPNYAQVRGWLRAPAAFSAADGTLTANGRPRRDELAARHAAAIDAIYAQALAC
jgi:long-subunit acyl-CoA synthetase (AMP-forming)